MKSRHVSPTVHKPFGIPLIVLLFFLTLTPVFSQDFYINKNSEAISVNYMIPPKWVDLNINESYEFLSSNGFTDIKTTSNYNKEIVSGTIRFNEYIYTRSLVFEDKVIKQYSDAIMFIHECVLCLANDMKQKFKYNPEMLNIIEKSYQTAEKADINLKEIFYKSHQISLKRDGIYSQLMGDLTDFGFKFSNSLETEDYNILRNCTLKLDENKIYEFYSQRIVTITAKNYLVGGYNLKDVNQYDLNLMVDVFLLDCKNNNIFVKKGKVITSFETLDGETLGLSYGINNDALIKLKIDPEKWNNASTPKRWYLIYHELGHDVLNLEHGNGGKMMFNFADRGYSWKEFWEDREYMLKNIKITTNTVNKTEIKKSDNPIIGIPIRIGNLLVAQKDFPKYMNWEDAKKVCSDLGEGWRLPSQEELNILYLNKDKIGTYVNENYWSSSEYNSSIAWLTELKSGRKSYSIKKYECNVRAVKNL